MVDTWHTNIYLTAAGMTLCSSFAPAPVLLVDLAHMLHLLGDGSLQPVFPLICRSQTPRPISAGAGIVFPGRVSGQRAALDPVHVIVGSADEIGLVHRAFKMDQTDFISTPNYYMDWIEGGA